MSTPAALAAKKMFATSTKTATFLLTMTPWKSYGARPARSRCSAEPWSYAARGASHRGHGSLVSRTGRGEPLRRPAADRRRIVRAGCLHQGAALVAGRADDLLEEGVRHSVGVMVGIDDQKVDGADVSTCTDGWSKSQDGP